MTHENPMWLGCGKQGSAPSKLAFSRAAFVNAAAALPAPRCRRRRAHKKMHASVCAGLSDGAWKHICPVCHCELIIFHLSTDLVITSACLSVCPGTAALAVLSLCSSGVPSTSFSHIAPGPQAAGTGELKVT